MYTQRAHLLLQEQRPHGGDGVHEVVVGGVHQRLQHGGHVGARHPLGATGALLLAQRPLHVLPQRRQPLPVLRRQRTELHLRRSQGGQANTMLSLDVESIRSRLSRLDRNDLSLSLSSVYEFMNGPLVFGAEQGAEQG